MAISHHIGFEIAESSLRFVEMRLTDRFPVILRTDIVETSKNYGSSLMHEAAYDYNLAKSFIRDVTDLLQNRPLFASNISVALPVSLPLITTLPIDAALSKKEKEKQLEWECKTLFSIGAETDLYVLSHSLENDDNVETYLVVALPRTTVSFIRSTFSHLTFDVRTIDVCHFMIENCIRNMALAKRKINSALIGFFPGFVAVSMFQENSYRGFQLETITYKEQSLSTALGLLSGILGKNANNTIDTIYAYGDSITEHLSSSLSTVLNLPVHLFEPIQRFSFLTGSDADLAAKHPPHLFNAALCAAWNGIL